MMNPIDFRQFDDNYSFYRKSQWVSLDFGYNKNDIENALAKMLGDGWQFETCIGNDFLFYKIVDKELK